MAALNELGESANGKIIERMPELQRATLLNVLIRACVFAGALLQSSFWRPLSGMRFAGVLVRENTARCRSRRRTSANTIGACLEFSSELQYVAAMLL